MYCHLWVCTGLWVCSYVDCGCVHVRSAIGLGVNMCVDCGCVMWSA